MLRKVMLGFLVVALAAPVVAWTPLGSTVPTSRYMIMRIEPVFSDVDGVHLSGPDAVRLLFSHPLEISANGVWLLSTRYRGKHLIMKMNGDWLRGFAFIERNRGNSDNVLGLSTRIGVLTTHGVRVGGTPSD
jgi:hypothetical protein